MADEILIEDLTEKTTAFNWEDEVIVNEYDSGGPSYTGKRMPMTEFAKRNMICFRKNIDLMVTGPINKIINGTAFDLKILPVYSLYRIIDKVGVIGTNPEIRIGTSSGGYADVSALTTISAVDDDNAGFLAAAVPMNVININTNSISIDVVTAADGVSTLTAEIILFCMVIE